MLFRSLFASLITTLFSSSPASSRPPSPFVSHLFPPPLYLSISGSSGLFSHPDKRAPRRQCPTCCPVCLLHRLKISPKSAESPRPVLSLVRRDGNRGEARPAVGVGGGATATIRRGFMQRHFNDVTAPPARSFQSLPPYSALPANPSVSWLQ